MKEGLAYARSLDERSPAQAIELRPRRRCALADARDLWGSDRARARGRSRAASSATPGAAPRCGNLIENAAKFGGKGRGGAGTCAGERYCGDPRP